MSLAGMAASLAVLALPQLGGNLGWIAIVGLLIYVGAFAVGPGPVFWLSLSEIYPLRISCMAMSIGTIANWGANLIVAVSFLTLTQIMGRPATFWLYGIIKIGGWVFTYFYVIKGKTLEQIKAHWQAGKGTRGF